MAEHAGENPVGIVRVNHDGANLLSIAQSEMFPGTAPIQRFINSVAGGKIRPAKAFAAAYVNHVRIRCCDSQSADCASLLIIKHGIPSAPIVRCSPDAAVIRRHKEDIRLRLYPRDSHAAPAAKWADQSPAQFLIKLGIELLGGGKSCGNRNERNNTNDHTANWDQMLSPERQSSINQPWDFVQ